MDNLTQTHRRHKYVSRSSKRKRDSIEEGGDISQSTTTPSTESNNMLTIQEEMAKDLIENDDLDSEIIAVE